MMGQASELRLPPRGARARPVLGFRYIRVPKVSVQVRLRKRVFEPPPTCRMHSQDCRDRASA